MKYPCATEQNTNCYSDVRVLLIIPRRFLAIITQDFKQHWSLGNCEYRFARRSLFTYVYPDMGFSERSCYMRLVVWFVWTNSDIVSTGSALLNVYRDSLASNITRTLEHKPDLVKWSQNFWQIYMYILNSWTIYNSITSLLCQYIIYVCAIHKIITSIDGNTRIDGFFHNVQRQTITLPNRILFQIIRNPIMEYKRADWHFY